MADPGSRGDLVIKERAITKIVTLTAAQVPGVSRSGNGLSRFTGRSLPRADVSVGTEAVAINLYVTLAWPSRIDDVGVRLRTAIETSVPDLIGLPVHELNIVVAGTSVEESANQAALDPNTADAFPARSETDAPLSTSTEDGASTGSAARLRPRTPRAVPAAVPAAVIIALLVIGLAVVAARELLIFHNAFDGAPWIRNTVEWAARLHWSEWIIPVIVACAAAGTVLLVAAIKPRPRTHVPISASAGAPVVWMRPTDVARTTSSHAAAVPGVAAARTTVTPKRVTVHVTAHDAGSDKVADIEAAVRIAVEPGLSQLGSTPTLRVKVRS
ncbi:MAG: Asp23/Gls24 family envelope stress response protein [Rhodococcus sp.]|nr:Asp23/Gls24 family envelope stress response protein [Rhodococcus sp. (in: high G+C Gram-positive bacteria)]